MPGLEFLDGWFRIPKCPSLTT